MVRVADLCPIPRGRGSRIIGQSFDLVTAKSGVFLLSRAAFMLSSSPRLRVRNGVRQMSGARVSCSSAGRPRQAKHSSNLTPCPQEWPEQIIHRPCSLPLNGLRWVQFASHCRFGNIRLCGRERVSSLRMKFCRFCFSLFAMQSKVPSAPGLPPSRLCRQRL